MKYLSVCSGIEAATVAWHHLGWEARAFSEIETFPRKVLAHHYPDVPCYGDFTTLKDEPWIGEADLLVGGTPCQAFSIAGLRQSLSDDRGNLSLEFVRLANAIDHLRPDGAGTIVVWENVPGVLSVKDNAFGCFLAALVGNDSPLLPTGGKWTNAGMVIGPQRSAAWRVLDAQYFGVAQRRRRVFVVASAREGFDPAEVLFEREGVPRNIAPRRNEGERVAPKVTSGAPFSRTGNDRTELDAIVGALGARTGLSKGVQDAECGHMIPYSIMPMNSGKDYKARETDIAQPLMANPVGGNQGGDYVVGLYANEGSHGMGNNEEVSVTLKADQKNAAAVAVNIYGGNKRPDRPEGGFYVRMDEETSKTLDAASGLNPTAAQGGTAVMQPNMAVRRLTPRECERLQGFPDDYTAIPNAADGPRYKALGNSMAVPVMRWIGERIDLACKG